MPHRMQRPTPHADDHNLKYTALHHPEVSNQKTEVGKAQDNEASAFGLLVRLTSDFRLLFCDDLVVMARRSTPDPIPNSAVKTLSADGTAS